MQEAIRYLFVSYVVAIKRCNIFMSVVLGGLFWKEKIVHRLPFVCLMVGHMGCMGRMVGHMGRMAGHMGCMAG